MSVPLLAIGVIMLIGAFASISSPNASSFDTDLSLLLFFAGIICIALGTGIVDTKTVTEKWHEWLHTPTSGK